LFLTKEKKVSTSTYVLRSTSRDPFGANT
jgi:hypothetical protein